MERVFIKHSDVLEALENYEKTGKLQKIGKKRRYNFTLDDDVMKKFRVHCYQNNLKMSSVIEDLIKNKVNR